MERTGKALSVRLVVASCFLFVSASTYAQVVYFDNFEQFPNGTTLLPTNYVPSSGPGGASASFVLDDSEPPPQAPTVTASNFLGSTMAFFNFAGKAGVSSYTCGLAASQTNQILTETWTLWNKGSVLQGEPPVFDGFDVMLPATNGTMQSILQFSDVGEMFALETNSTVGNNYFIGVGSYPSGTLMTNQLIVNYPANTFSFSLNGVVLTNMTLCGLFTNLVAQTGFDAFEEGEVPVFTRQFALDDVMVQAAQVPEPASSAMVILGAVTFLAGRQSRRRPS
jgi:hypothetical protein